MAGLYLHIPFCERKCIYCDFYSLENRGMLPEFIRLLHAEIDLVRERVGPSNAQTAFFGGGTPSLLGAEVVASLIDHLGRAFSLDAGAEVTLEANPGTTDLQKLRELRSAGVTRISLGVQSFHDRDLEVLSRIHSAREARRSVELAREAGFTNISIDLIFGIPGQTLAAWEENLRQAVALFPEHISAYSLIVEEGTPLEHMIREGTVAPAAGETEAGMYELTMQFLHDSLYEQYEVSNYARAGYRSLHNCNYWNHEPYLGFGPSAHSFQGKKRWWNAPDLSWYCSQLSLGRLPVAGEETLSPRQLLDEEIMLGLRSSGVDLARLQSEHGVDLLSEVGSTVLPLLDAGLALLDRGHLRLTPKGYMICDGICEELLARLPHAG